MLVVKERRGRLLLQGGRPQNIHDRRHQHLCTVLDRVLPMLRVRWREIIAAIDVVRMSAAITFKRKEI